VKVVRNVGSKIVKIATIGQVASSDLGHLNVVNPLASFECDPIHPQLVTSRKVILIATYSISIRENLSSGQRFFAWEQEFNPLAGSYHPCAQDALVNVRHRHRLHGGSVKVYLIPDFITWQTPNRVIFPDEIEFIKQDGSLHTVSTGFLSLGEPDINHVEEYMRLKDWDDYAQSIYHRIVYHKISYAIE
jgi:hypothetical protein